MINHIFKRQKLKHWKRKVPSLSFGKEKKWEEVEKIKIDKRKFAIRALKDQGLKITEENLKRAFDQIT
jgi:hypothetical protein